MYTSLLFVMAEQTVDLFFLPPSCYVVEAMVGCEQGLEDRWVAFEEQVHVFAERVELDVDVAEA